MGAYSGDSNYAAAQSGVAPLQVVSSTTTTSLTASPNPATAGQSVTLTATLGGISGLTPTGTIAFLNGATQSGTATVSSSGVATMATSSLAAGNYTLTAQYSGNTSLASSTSPKLSLSVTGSAAQSTTTALSATPNPVAAGQALTLTANVKGATTPTGSVTFLNGSSTLGTATLNSLGIATLSTSSLTAGTYNLTVQYAGNSTSQASTSAAVQVTVNANAQSTTTGLSATPNPVAAGQALTLTATVKGATTPTGSVTFLNGSSTLGTATLNSLGIATLSTSSLTAGTYNLTVQYAGNSTSQASTSAAVQVTVNANAQSTTTALSATPNPVAAGQALTLTANVKGTTTPTGSVTFLNGSSTLGTATLNSSGIATLSTSSLAAGSYNLTAQYAGNTSSQASTSAAVQVTVSANSRTTTTSLSATPNPVVAGQELSLTATVRGAGSTTPTGSVTFFNGATVLGTVTLNNSGVTTLANTSLAAGSYNLTAQYSGNTKYESSTSAPVSITVSGAGQATATSLSATPNPVTAGHELTLVATVTGGATAPTGSVTFLNGTTSLGTVTLSSSGVATLTYSALPAGNYSLAAVYAPNAGFRASTSSAVPVTVTAAAQTTTTILSASPNPVIDGQLLTLTASVKGTATPSGTVTFFNGSASLGTATLNSSGVATVSVSSLAAGTYNLTAQYAGNTSSQASTSAAVPVTVTAAAASAEPTTTTLIATPNPVTAGQALSLTANVKSAGSTTPTGSVTFLNGSSSLGTVALNNSGATTLVSTSLPVGTYNLTAQYAGAGSFQSSTSSAVSLTVNASSAQSTATVLKVTPNPVTSGQMLTLTAAVTGSGGPVPAGTVSFLNGSTLLGAATLNSSDTAALSVNSLAPGTYSLTAQYTPTTNANSQSTSNSPSLSSTSAAVSVTVEAAAIAGAPPFNFGPAGSNNQSQTILPGDTAVFSFAVSPTSGNTLPAITFSASGVPTNATAIFSPQMIQAGSSATNVTLSIHTSPQSAKLQGNRNLGEGGLSAIALALMILPFGRTIRRTGKRWIRIYGVVPLLVGTLSIVGLTGCAGVNYGAGGGQTYNVTVTTTSGSVSQATTVVLIMK